MKARGIAVVGLVGLCVAAVAAPVAAAPFPHLQKIVAVKSVTASSTYADKNNAYAPTKTLVYETKGGTMDQPEVTMWSAWCEGKKDEGIGESVTITLAEPTQIDSIKIAAGVWRTQKLFTSNNIITSLEVSIDGKAKKVAPKAAREWFELKVGAKVTTLGFKIAAVKKGTMNDTCIAGIDLVSGESRITPIIGGDPKLIAAFPGALKEIQTALEKEDKKGLEPLVEFPFSNHDADGFFMGGGGATKVANWKALVAACTAYKNAPEADWVDPKGCPLAADHDPDDDRAASIQIVAPDRFVVRFSSHREVGTTWQLHYKDRWRLSAIDYDGF